MILIYSICVCADESFSENDYNKAVSITENTWEVFDFNKDLFFKINVSDKNKTTVFEVLSDGYEAIMEYYVFTKGSNSLLTQKNKSSIPGYISIAHIDDVESSYIKLDYNSPENAELINKKIKLRIITVENNILGWDEAKTIGLNEEHAISFSSMNDDRWYKLVVPDEQFKYTYTIKTSNVGCFVSELYTQEDLISGKNRSLFSDCINIESQKYTITAQLETGTYYMHIYPVPLYDDVLNSKIIFATDNKNSNEVTVTSFGAQVSVWAAPEIEMAFNNNLIPEVMINFDLTKKVNRGEFAAIAVQLYETLSMENITEATDCTFVDIKYNDNEKAIKKAYQIEVAQGTSSTTYEPLSNINREQLATMLCRVIKKYGYPDWTMATDSQYNLNIDGVTLFADDNEISDWAKPSVYFMAKNGIIKGVSDTLFAPKNTTSHQEASGYASATREQAIILAQRIFTHPDIFVDFTN